MFFTRHLSKMLLVMGLATASVFIFAIAPQWAIVNILRLPYSETFAANYFNQGHHLIYQHWGVMVGFMGVVMVVGAGITVQGGQAHRFAPSGPEIHRALHNIMP